MNLILEWERMRMMLRAHVQAGKGLRSISERSGVSRATLINWIAWDWPPETVEKAAAVMEVLDDDATRKDAKG